MKRWLRKAIQKLEAKRKAHVTNKLHVFSKNAFGNVCIFHIGYSVSDFNLDEVAEERMRGNIPPRPNTI
jgi:hypothetical protein